MYDKDHVIKMLEEIVAEKGEDYVYESPINEEDVNPLDAKSWFSCYYADPATEQPSCGVGRVLAKDNLFHIRVEGASVIGLPGIQDHYTQEALEVLQNFQDHQDNGISWGEALQNAKDGISYGK